jgi:alpha-glucosidase
MLLGIPSIEPPEIAHIVGRDPERTPMQWDSSPNAGFAASDVKELWLPLAPDYQEVNVASQLSDPRSMLNFYRRLLAYRKASPALQWGSYRSLEAASPKAQANCFVFERGAADQRLLVALNFSGQEQNLSLPEVSRGRVVLSTARDREGEVNLADFNLRANEGCIIEL